MGRKKFNMDPKKVRTRSELIYSTTVQRFNGRLVTWSAHISSYMLSLIKQGIQFLLENDLLQNTPEDIAQFLYKGEGLNKTVIGDYLGERWALWFSLCFLPNSLS